jgi:hypothetical protein
MIFLLKIVEINTYLEARFFWAYNKMKTWNDCEIMVYIFHSRFKNWKCVPLKKTNEIYLWKTDRYIFHVCSHCSILNDKAHFPIIISKCIFQRRNENGSEKIFTFLWQKKEIDTHEYKSIFRTCIYLTIRE